MFRTPKNEYLFYGVEASSKAYESSTFCSSDGNQCSCSATELVETCEMEVGRGRVKYFIFLEFDIFR